MISRRIVANLAFFATIGVALGWWAIGDVLQLDLRHPRYEITADFEDSPGLQPGYDVGYLGTPIGRIKAVNLRDGHVQVVLSIDEDRRVPAGSTLAVRRKSAVGEPYVDVIPPEGATADGPAMAPGDHVPLDHTLTPLSYSDLFEALDQLVSSVPPDDLGRLMHEMAVGLDGRAGSLRQLITNSSDIVHTFAENSDVIEHTMASLSRLVQVFAEHGDSMGEGLRNTRDFTGTLADARRDLERVLVHGDDLATRTADLVAGSEGELTCIFGDLSALAIRLGQPDVAAALTDLLATAPDAAPVFDDVIAWEPDGPYVRATPPVNIGGNDVRDAQVYDHPHELPDVPAGPGCPGMTPNGAPGGAAAAGAEGGGQADAAASPATDPGPRARHQRELASSDRDVGDGGFNPLWLVGALLALSLLAAIRPWRWLQRRG